MKFIVLLHGHWSIARVGVFSTEGVHKQRVLSTLCDTDLPESFIHGESEIHLFWTFERLKHCSIKHCICGWIVSTLLIHAAIMNLKTHMHAHTTS